MAGEHIEQALDQIRGLFDRPAAEEDKLPNGTIFRIKLKGGLTYTIIRQAHYLSSAAKKDVWKQDQNRMTWFELNRWLHQQNQHIEWIRMINPDTTKITQVWPGSGEWTNPNEMAISEELEDEDWESVQVDGVLYQASFNNRSLGQFGTLRDAKERITDRFETELAWTRANAFTWRPNNDGLDGYVITRTKGGRRE